MSPYVLPDGQLIGDQSQFTLNGIQYPANWLSLASAQELDDLGVQHYTSGPSLTDYDDRFYSGLDEAGEPIAYPLEVLKYKYRAEIRSAATSILASTDWMIIRKADTGVPVDPAISAWRQSVRDAVTSKTAILEAATSAAEVASYVTGVDYPVWPLLEAGELSVPGDWSGFFDALLVSGVFAAARQAAAVDVAANAAYTDLAAGLGLAKQGNPNIPALQVGFDNMLALLELTPEQQSELASLIAEHEIPISLS